MQPGDFVVEYAKSGRARCQTCRSPIAKDTVRGGVVSQGFNFDGLTTQWHHVRCLQKKPIAKRICQDNLHGLSELRWEDQQDFIKRFPAADGGPAPNPHGLQVEIAKSNRSTCRGCSENIERGKMRIGVRVDEEVGGEKRFNLALQAWHHPRCFFEYHGEMVTRGVDSFDDVDKLDEWNTRVLSALVNGEDPPSEPENSDDDNDDDHGKKVGDGDASVEDIKEESPPRKLRSSKRLASAAAADEDVSLAKRAKKIKKEREDKDPAKPASSNNASGTPVKEDPETLARQSAFRDQTNAVWAARDLLPTTQANRNKYTDILSANGMKGIEFKTVQQMVNILADAMVFGVAQVCPGCGTTRLVPNESNYACPAHLEWGRCGYTSTTPEFEPLCVAPDETLPWTENYRYTPRPRLFARAPKGEAAPPLTADELKAGIKDKKAQKDEAVIETDKPFENRAFIFAGRLPKTARQYQSLVEKGGGSVTTLENVEQNTSMVFLITTKAELDKNSKKIEESRKAGIDILDASYITDCHEQGTRFSWKDEKYLLERNTTDPVRESGSRENRARGEEGEERRAKRLLVKNGAIVDPDSHLEQSHHVYKEGKLLWSVVLCTSDIAANRNAFYKLQILESDVGRRHVLFRSWGRIGTTRGGTKSEAMDLESCKEEFERLYLDKSGHQFGDPDQTKVPGRMFLLDMEGDNGEADSTLEDVSRAADTPSKLAPEIQNLVKLIFDVQIMRNALREMEIDLRKMPLGKLSAGMITEAFTVLSEAMDLVAGGAKDLATKTKIVQLSNHFFTVIPHDFGSSNAPLLDNSEIIRAKLDTLDTLRDIGKDINFSRLVNIGWPANMSPTEIATNMLKKDTDTSDEFEHPIDKEFRKLNTAMEVLDASSDEYKMIKRCTQTTHAPTHAEYTLAIKNVFKIQRAGENEKYTGIEIPNKALLWHGSRLSNYAGILSQGLRIAPPEAPVTGYMFGKGIYFADMVSKSANYCNASARQKTGCGQTGPSSTEYLPGTHPDDPVWVPMGPPAPQELPGRAKKTELLYNEHIIYNEKQCTLRYLVQVQFSFKK
ncbi:Poly [ADP-ribose] polymerase 1 [Geranomyces michiganensis]|nr:Poly [ADP-ribose] polymerase 1 [Geranomyces michiganensis]